MKSGDKMLASARYLLCAIVLSAFSLNAPAYAGGVSLPHIDVEKIKTACSSNSVRFWDTGVTSDRMQGSMEYRECLKSALLAYWKQLGTDHGQKEFDKDLSDFTNPFIGMVNNIYLGNRACPCGTMYNDMYSLLTAEVYVILLEAMAEASANN